MTLAVLNIQTTTPSARDLMDRALDPHILIGMPHLNAHGLSETWLMKELGHRHWLMLARDLGMQDADFRTVGGGEAYAAICATSIRSAKLGLVTANDVVTLRSSLTPVSRTQMSSRHRVCVADIEIADVELLSTFVHRLAAGDNHSIARVALSGNFSASFRENHLARSAAEMRATVRGHSRGPENQSLIGNFSFRTSLSQDFNGAGLFYFAEFQALMDRASEEQSTDDMPQQISSREVYFFGNIRGNETVKVEVFSAPTEPFLSEYRIFREDGKIIAHARCCRRHRSL